MTDREVELEETLVRIEQWCRAYPTTMFGTVADEDVIRAAEVLKEHDISISALHGQWGRHILKGILDIIVMAKSK